ncbi:hypothetical protein [Kordiimonas sp.]|uniref:hypothetical protein n=1 Tax=Kordiimonas sp. TaxID=1970157 RepID=UPI003B52BB1B
MLTPSETIEFEYKCVEWRNFEAENVQSKFDALSQEGWELDGPEHVKSGMFADLYWQQFRRRKKPTDAERT